MTNSYQHACRVCGKVISSQKNKKKLCCKREMEIYFPFLGHPLKEPKDERLTRRGPTFVEVLMTKSKEQINCYLKGL